MNTSDMYTTLSTRTKNKLSRIQQNIFQLYPEISELGIQIYDHTGFRGGKSGFELCFQIKSKKLNDAETDISCVFTRDISQVESSSIMRQFRQRYTSCVYNIH